MLHKQRFLILVNIWLRNILYNLHLRWHFKLLSVSVSKIKTLTLFSGDLFILPNLNLKKRKKERKHYSNGPFWKFPSQIFFLKYMSKISYKKFRKNPNDLFLSSRLFKYVYWEQHDTSHNYRKKFLLEHFTKHS